MIRLARPDSRKGKPAACVLALSGPACLAVFLLAGCPGLSPATSDNKPTVTAPPNQVVECDGSGNEAALTAWLNSATFTDECADATLRNDFQALATACGDTGAVTVTWTVTDSCGNSASDSATFTIVDTTSPTLSTPQPISVNCGDPETTASLAAWLASASATDACSDVSITTQRVAEPGGCTATITWIATDDCGNAASLSSTYTTTGDTTPPAMTLNGDPTVTIECGTEWQDPGVTLSDDCDALIRATSSGDVQRNVPGTYVLTYTALDACGNAAQPLTRNVSVVDTTPPVVTLSAPKALWPPNHRMAAMTLADLATINDACDGELDANLVGTILDIYCDEPDNDNGDGNTTGDIVIADDHTFSVRVERKGGGNGRVYGIRFEVSDSSGNTVEATAFLHVPHDQSGRAVVDDGAASGQIVTR